VVRQQLLRLYELMDFHVQAKESAKAQLKALGRRYPEVREFNSDFRVAPHAVHRCG
jgi:hypothetical protein